MPLMWTLARVAPQPPTPGRGIRRDPGFLLIAAAWDTRPYLCGMGDAVGQR
jgi:hypothetical protein